MKLKALIEKAEALFDSQEQDRRKNIKKVLKKLRKHEKSLTAKLQNESDPEVVAKLEKKILLAHTQRKKGINILKEIKAKKVNSPKLKNTH